MNPLLDIREAAFTEVLARVSYRLIERDYYYGSHDYRDPALAMMVLAQEYQLTGFSVMACWIRAYCVQWSPLTKIDYLRREMIRRARSGMTWRRVVYPAYKAYRWSDPRVTNRGVTGSPRKPRGQ